LRLATGRALSGNSSSNGRNLREANEIIEYLQGIVSVQCEPMMREMANTTSSMKEDIQLNGNGYM
jgi:hypothetical protein